MNIGQVYSLLARGVVDITFTKANGELRHMKATISEVHLPEESRGRNHGADETAQALSVYDTEAKGWRAFRYDSLKTVNGKVVSLASSMLSE